MKEYIVFFFKHPISFLVLSVCSIWVYWQINMFGKVLIPNLDIK